MKEILKKIIVSIITFEAKLVLKRYKPKIIAVTGSVGKTSTKDAIFCALKDFKSVRKSEKSFNSEIGLPLTILGCPNGWNNFWVWVENIFRGFILILFKHKYPEYLVLEVGVGKPGDIKKNVLPWLKTDMVVITRFPDKPVHVEFFNNVEEIIEEKSSLVRTLKKNGLLILNHDDERVYNLHTKVNCRVVSFGFNENATYRAIFANYSYKNSGSFSMPEGINFKLIYNGNTFPVSLPYVFGMHNIGQALSAIAVSNELGCDILETIRAVSNYKTPPGRLSFIEGKNNSVIIDDTYNSSPIAAESALSVLESVKSLRKIAVLGDMLELGKFTEEEHLLLGEKASKIVDLLITVGPRAKSIAEGAKKVGFGAKNIYAFDKNVEASDFLEKTIKEGDVVLIKGSQGIRLEKVVERVMAHPENKEKLLCRQEREWQSR